MKIKNKLAVLMVCCLPFGGANATGIPVFDGANLTQWLTDIAWQQGTVWPERIAEITRQVEELNKLRNRVKSIQWYLDAGDLVAALHMAAPYIGNEAINQLILLDPGAGDFESSVRSIIEADVGHSPEDFSTITTLLGAVGSSAGGYQKGVERDHYAQQLYVDQVRYAADAEKQTQGRTAKYNELSNTLVSLGDESETATLQLLAAEVQLLSQQNEQMIQILNQIAVNQTRPDMLNASYRAQERREEIDRAASMHNSAIAYSTWTPARMD